MLRKKETKAQRKERHVKELAELEEQCWGNGADANDSDSEAEEVSEEEAAEEMSISNDLLQEEREQGEIDSEETAEKTDEFKNKSNRTIHNLLVKRGIFSHNYQLKSESSTRAIEDSREDYQAFVKKILKAS